MANPDKFIRLRDFAKIMRTLRESDVDGTTFHYDDEEREYTNVREYYAQHRSGLIYGVKFPRYSFSHVPTGVKTHDNADLSVTVSTAANAGRDDYAYLNAFQWRDVNATVDDSGVPHITAIEGDSRFRRDGSNGDVFVMVAPGYFRVDGDDNHIELLYSDEQYDGFEPMPGLLLPDGTERPCLLFAKYGASLSGGIPHSWSGQKIDPGFGCQNDQITLAQKKGKGYAGQCQPDVFYFQLMLMLKFATKDMEAALGGCFENYTAQGAVTKAESNAKRVIVSKDTADGILVGSTINIGTDKERNNAANHSVAEARTVTSKTTIDATNVALNIDGAAITTTTSTFVSTMPWKTGATDSIRGRGDGRPQSDHAGWQPVRLQGIERGSGIYEVDSDAIVNAYLDADGVGHDALYLVHDITKASKTSTDGYTLVGEFPTRDKTNDASSRFAEDFAIADGRVFLPTGIGATSSTGLTDAVYADPVQSQGLRQVPRFGNLGDGSNCGAFPAYLLWDLTFRWWNIGGRLSALGRSKA